MLIQTFLNNLGTDTVAAWSAFGKIDSLYWMVNNAFGIAVTTFVGQNFGAGKYDRMKKECPHRALYGALYSSDIDSHIL